jgi:hypothetical protein
MPEPAHQGRAEWAGNQIQADARMGRHDKTGGHVLAHARGADWKLARVWLLEKMTGERDDGC